MTHKDIIKLASEVKQHIKQISPDEAEKTIQENDVIIFDVREDYEYQAGHLDKAKNLSWTEIEAKVVERLIPDKSTPIICYCAGGNRSALATNSLNKLGYENVVSLEGGITAWTNQNKEITTAEKTPEGQKAKRLGDFKIGNHQG
ncbi:rhodanese-like domain-containing protein [Geminocystis sp. GBBB08]|uniref:rhodanese-like domain-containing protein n=1 Tax=Geminocystis sp. GBBB08 TaxID=2604140 RepID=UPI0027E29EBD|nr:rhodanese-like domain-containing protein [Geminocystis sp. GBBB08]MBL1211488.1 rhodanese-like domain-containing protein [Geminocystis sp. GBBB08]